jgi:hypothetical protein
MFIGENEIWTNTVTSGLPKKMSSKMIVLRTYQCAQDSMFNNEVWDEEQPNIIVSTLHRADFQHQLNAVSFYQQVPMDWCWRNDAPTQTWTVNVFCKQCQKRSAQQAASGHAPPIPGNDFVSKQSRVSVALLVVAWTENSFIIRNAKGRNPDVCVVPGRHNDGCLLQQKYLWKIIQYHGTQHFSRVSPMVDCIFVLEIKEWLHYIRPPCDIITKGNQITVLIAWKWNDFLVPEGYLKERHSYATPEEARKTWDECQWSLQPLQPASTTDQHEKCRIPGLLSLQCSENRFDIQ